MEGSEIEVPSLQDDNVRAKIRTHYLRGKPINQILAEMNIPQGTWDSALWRNTGALQGFMQDLKREYFLTLAENVSKEVMAEDHENNAKILAIKQKEAEFLRETLGKDTGYSKRLETIGLNLNKNEPLNDEQKAKLDKILAKSGMESVKDAEVVETVAQDCSTTTNVAQ